MIMDVGDTWKSGVVLVAGMGCGIAIGWILRGRALNSSAAVVRESLPTVKSNSSPAASASAFAASLVRDYKMALVVRTDLKMGKGKAAAQCCHAAVACCQKTLARDPRILHQWEDYGQTKVVLKVETEEDLLVLAREAKAAGLQTYVVADAGRTQIAPGSKTVLGIGPGPTPTVEAVTRDLKLY